MALVFACRSAQALAEGASHGEACEDGSDDQDDDETGAEHESGEEGGHRIAEPTNAQGEWKAAPLHAQRKPSHQPMVEEYLGNKVSGALNKPNAKPRVEFTKKRPDQRQDRYGR